MGLSLIPRLLRRGHELRVLVRPGSEKKLPRGCTPVVENVLDGSSYEDKISPGQVCPVGRSSHPSPAKAADFRKVDLVSGLEAVAAAKSANVRHFVYLSVAHPAPVMKAYIAVRAECEAAIEAAGLPILRPWYVLGLGHRWPSLLLPMYKLAELLPQTRDGALRLGLVTLEQMVTARLAAVENPAQGVKVVNVPEIRTARA